MDHIKMNGVIVPTDVPNHAIQNYLEHYHALTHGTGQLFLFSCDQKLEHLNDDFHGPAVDTAAQDPEHFFRIAQSGSIGGIALHLGLINRYARLYPQLNYIAKLNGTTHLRSAVADPFSPMLWDVAQVQQIIDEGVVTIRGIGITLYLGSEYESAMLEQAAQAIYYAHQQGLIAIVWAYARGKVITNDLDTQLIAGAAGVAASLGADFVKVKVPMRNKQEDIHGLKTVVAAAGTTRVVCSGGSKKPVNDFLHNVHDQLNQGLTAGCAVGRNIFQHSLIDAVSLTHALSALVFHQASVAKAMAIYEQAKEQQQLLQK